MPKGVYKRIKSRKGEKKLPPKLLVESNGILCNYGCGQEARFQFKNEKYCCSRNHASCPTEKDTVRKANLGILNPMFGKVSWNKNKEYHPGKFHWSWIGGNINYQHKLAWKLFGENKCEICGKSNEQELLKTKKTFIYALYFNP